MLLYKPAIAPFTFSPNYCSHEDRKALETLIKETVLYEQEPQNQQALTAIHYGGMAHSHCLQSDGISEEFFNLLWSKDELNFGPIINIPDTVVFKLGVPTSWYFTSLDGRVKRKKRVNLINSVIEQSFTSHALGYDILATFISFPIEVDQLRRFSTIEYFDIQTLGHFLQRQNEGRSGILQRFIEPNGTKNDIIRAIWSPKICLLQRTENIYHLHDQRYGLYERCVTDEGPEHFSTSTSLRGAALTNQIQNVCETIVTHISEVTYGRTQVSRLVINLKVDSRDKLWLLHTTSISCHCDVLGSNEESIGRMTKKSFIGRKVLMNVDSVFSLPDVVNLNPVKSYEDIRTRKSKSRVRCLSCTEETLDHTRHPVSYKSIVKHYEHVLHLLEENYAFTLKTSTRSALAVSKRSHVIRWPPDSEIVTAAGGVGFGCIDLINDGSSSSSSNSSSSCYSPTISLIDLHDKEKNISVPPILRYIHPKLGAASFERCRRDPLFLFKTVPVCESCFLVYAEFTTMLLRTGQNGTNIMKSDLSARKATDRPAVMSRPSSADWRAISVHRSSSELVDRSHSGYSSVIFNPSENHLIAKSSAIGLRSSDTRRIPTIPLVIRVGDAEFRGPSSRGSQGQFSRGSCSPMIYLTQEVSTGRLICDRVSLSSSREQVNSDSNRYEKYVTNSEGSPYLQIQSRISSAKFHSITNSKMEIPPSNLDECSLVLLKTSQSSSNHRDFLQNALKSIEVDV